MHKEILLFKVLNMHKDTFAGHKVFTFSQIEKGFN